MKKRFRFFSALLAALLLFLPLSPLTGGPFGGIRAVAAGSSGSCTWRMLGPILYIEGSGAMANYSPINPTPWGTNFSHVNVSEGVTVIGEYAFAGSNLGSVTLPLSLSTIGAHAFENCTSFSSFPLAATAVSNIGDYAFYGCTALPSLAELPETVQTIGDHAFGGCTALRMISIPETLETVFPTAFIGCTALTQISVDEANPRFSDTDGILMNRDKTALLCYPAGKTDANYNVPATVTVIGENAVQSSTLKSVFLSANVTTVEKAAFQDCTALTDVYFAGTAQEWEEVSVASQNSPLLGATMHFNHCPAAGDGNHRFEQGSDVCAYSRCSYKRTLPPVLKGDTNGNGTVDSDDAIYLLYNSLLGEARYPLNQPCDFNADGSVNSDDAIYLLYNTLLGGERYPLKT